MAPPPIVTGISPNEGPPGTRIKIRGEHFGTIPTDLIGLMICGCDCLLSAEWKSSSKILAISGPAKGKGDVIVTTRSGGIGTCSVGFKGYYEPVGTLKDSALWVEETPLFAWGRHSLSSGSFQQDDPLGLSVEETEKKIPEDDLIELFPDASGDIASENFSACWFLLENHQTTSFNDMQAGLLHLRRKVEGQKEGQLSFLKTNIGSVMDQVDTLMILKEKYQKDINLFSNEPTLKLEKAIKESEREARKLFDDVLTRRDRAEKTRNALNVLARFKFLFCLPYSIEKNIKKGDYDIVINDYMRVKNLFLKRDVSVFKMALNEIEKRIIDLQKMLHDKLTHMPINIDEQKKLIRYLVNLESPYEPAWDAIKAHSDYIHDRIKQCYERHKVMQANFNETIRKSKNSHSASKYSKYASPQDINMCPKHTFVVEVSFFEELCEVISELFPHIWKLGQAYFIGELHVQIEAGHKTSFKHMILSIMDIFCKRLRAVVIPNTLDKNVDKLYGNWTLPEIDVIADHLPDMLRLVRCTYSILIKLDLPSEALDIVLGFIVDLRIHCMSILFKKTTDRIKKFDKQETWKIEFCGTYNGITELPIEFEQSVQDVIQIVKESALTNEPREGLLLDNPSAQKELEKQVENVLIAFHSVLKNLAKNNGDDDDDDSSPVVSQLVGARMPAYRTLKRHVPIWEHRLLTTLSNCQHTNNIVLHNIVNAFTKSGYVVPTHVIENVKTNFESLEMYILESYLERKSDPLVGTIEPSMYLGHFDWDTIVQPTDLRPYAKECINNLIHVHAEVNSISPSLVNSVLPQVVQTIAEELYRLMSCVQKFSISGIQQAKADIYALQEFFSSYLTTKARAFFQEALEIIPPLQESEQVIIEDILKQCRVRMKLQMLCLQHQNNGPKT